MKIIIIIILIIFCVPPALFANSVWGEFSYRVSGSYCHLYHRFVTYDTGTCELGSYGENLVRVLHIDQCNNSNTDWQNYDSHADYPEGESVGGCDGSTRYYDCSPVYTDANDFSGQFPDTEQWWYYTSTGSDNNTYNCMSIYMNSAGDVTDHRSSDYHSIDPSASSDCVSDQAFAAINSNLNSCDQPLNAFNMGVETTFDDPNSTYVCIDANGDGADDTTGAGCALVATPRAEDNIGDPGNNAGAGNVKGCPEGAPVWKINMVNMNLYMTDVPLWYDSPVGPPVRIQLSYNSESTLLQAEPFGEKWTFNYRSFLDIDTDGNVTVFMPDGRSDLFLLDESGSYTKPLGVFNSLEKISDNHYRLLFITGGYYVYKIPEDSDLLTPFLVEISDAYDQKIVLGYGGNDRLETITDALGRITALVDDNNDGLVERINDPFGRSAYFTYDTNGNLVTITDMGGYSSGFTYDDQLYVTSISNQRGTWDIDIETSDGMIDPSITYPAPGESMGENYRITITDPLGNQEEYYYNGAYSWYISPKDYTSYESNEINNYRSSPKSIYVLTGNRQARKIGRMQYPEGGYLEYEYDSLTGKPLSVTDSHGDLIEHTREFSYNVYGLATSMKDPKSNATFIDYYPNSTDVHTVVNGLGTITYTYNEAHDVTSVTDRLNNVTALAYNLYGQLIEVIEGSGTPLQISTMFVYDPDTHDLLEIKKNNNVMISNNYDDIGRIAASTDAAGLSLGYEYNDLDQITKVTYPDAKYEQFDHSSCCPRLIESRTARSGLTTYYEYDSLKRLVSVQRAENVLGYEYDANNNIIKLTNENGNATFFEYDLDNRLIRKIYSDSTSIAYSYDLAGLLLDVVNARGIRKSYLYDENHNVTEVSYSDDTPGVMLSYDHYNRVTGKSDGIGGYQYSYNANNRLISADGPWDDDTIDLQYDELGRLQTMIPQKGNAVNNLYDGIGRLTELHSGLNVFSYEYIGESSFVKSLTRQNGNVTEYDYDDPLKRLTVIIDKRSSGEMIREKTFLYNELDLIEKETSTDLEKVAPFQKGVTMYNYNSTDQLIKSLNPDLMNEYDNDGNMAAYYSPDGYQVDMIYDAENRLKSIEYVDEEDVVHKTEYFYNGDNMLAEIRKYEEGTLLDTMRLVRNGFSVLQERDAENNVTNEYTWGVGMGGGIGGLLNLKRDGLDYSYLYDGRGNVSAVLDSSENVVVSYGYNVFGRRISKTGDFDQPFQFSTKRYDEVTGLSYYGYRFYNSAIGRWMTRDPIGEAGGMNLYGFVGNNPVNRIDANGLWGSDVHSGIGNSEYGTYKWAMEMGIADGLAKEIAVSTNNADNNLNFLPLIGTPGRHFNTTGDRDSRDTIAEQNMQLAIQMYKGGNKETAFKLLGIGLHAIQDKVAHGQWPFYKVHPEWFDSAQKRPDAIAVTEYLTKKYMQEFLRETCN